MPNPKLEYDARTPAFLQKLKGQYVAADGRHNIQFSRPKKQLIDADDDAPTYVDEASHETISKEEYEKLTQGPIEEKPEQRDASVERSPATTTSDHSALKPAQAQASFGSANKRKAGKILGAEDEPDESTANAVKSNDDSLTSDKRVKRPAAKVKKAKKIKLSFDEG